MLGLPFELLFLKMNSNNMSDRQPGNFSSKPKSFSRLLYPKIIPSTLITETVALEQPGIVYFLKKEWR